ncbi:MAG: 4-hydroxybenzoate decarboxylase [Chlamydiales bacterium]|jgi:UbiD family decarboxylase|nr:4-hydroxybenzoate decarboxylase [Chlamydiales bacterium]
MVGIANLRQWITLLRQHNEIVDIYHEVDSHLEIAEIHRRIAEQNGPALLFHNVKNSSFPVVTNLFGSYKRVQLAFPSDLEEWLAKFIDLITKNPPNLTSFWKGRSLFSRLMNIGTRKRWTKAPVMETLQSPTDLCKLPLLQLWPEDGGHFITLPLVYTEPVNGGPPNLGMYRIQRYNADTTGIHWQIGKGGGFHYYQAEQQNRPLPVNISIGGPPALILSAIMPLPENVPEILLAGLLQDGKLTTSSSPFNNYPIFSECEFTLVGYVKPKERQLEGPFGDHYGYYSLAHDFPVFHCQAVYHRKDAIYPATVVGKPRQEDYYLGNYLQKLLSPLFPVVMPGVKDLWSYGETGFHSLGAAIVRERYYRESMASAFRILGEGQLALTKFLMLTDQTVNLENFKELLTIILERFRPETDLFIFANLSLDTLDYTGPELNKGSRGVMLGCGDPIRKLPIEYTEGQPSRLIKEIAPFSPGCLVLSVNHKDITDKEMQQILQYPQFNQWPLLVLVDSVEETVASEASFLWTVFTRFEPAADIYARETTIYRHHLSYKGPILIDARMKPSYPAVVACDSETDALVSKNWNLYFSKQK